MDPLLLEPDINSRLDELYDHESHVHQCSIRCMAMEGRLRDGPVGPGIHEEQLRESGLLHRTTPALLLVEHTMFNDPDQDGVNGNEQVTRKTLNSTSHGTSPASSMVSPVDCREWRLRLRGFTVPVSISPTVLLPLIPLRYSNTRT